MVARLAEIRAARCGSSPAERSVSDSDYARAFAAYGVPVDGTPIGETAARIRARPRAVVVELAAALADWASARQGSARSRGEWTRLLEAGGLSDPDDYRGAIRAAFQLPDRQARQASLKRLATDAAKIDAFSAARLGLLGKALAAVGEVELAVSVLQRAHQRFAGDVWINFDLAMARKEPPPAKDGRSDSLLHGGPGTAPGVGACSRPCFARGASRRRGNHGIPWPLRNQAEHRAPPPLPRDRVKTERGYSGGERGIRPSHRRIPRNSQELSGRLRHPSWRSAKPSLARGSWMRRSASTARRCGSTRMTPKPTMVSASL